VYTIANQRKYICGKLDVHSTAEIAAYSLTSGFGGNPHSTG